jgi:hypothetical protein
MNDMAHWLSLDKQPRMIGKESVYIAIFFDQFVGGFARTVARAAFDADDFGIWSGLRGLQRADIFKAMPRNHAVVGVGGRYNHGGVVRP